MSKALPVNEMIADIRDFYAGFEAKYGVKVPSQRCQIYPDLMTVIRSAAEADPSLRDNAHYDDSYLYLTFGNFNLTLVAHIPDVPPPAPVEVSAPIQPAPTTEVEVVLFPADPTQPERTLTILAGTAAYWGERCVALLGDGGTGDLAGADWPGETPNLPYLGFIAQQELAA